MKMKLLIAGAVVVVVVIGLYLSSQQATAPTSDTTEVNDAAPTDTDAESDTESVESNEADTVSDTPVSAPASTPKQSTTQTPMPVATTPKPKVQTPALPYNVSVVFDGGRFIPDEVTVIQGGTVRFINASDNLMWIASASHLKHELYRGKSYDDCMGSSFDQCESVGPGGSWSFTFDYLGTWKYHNHMLGQYTGEVSVRTVEEYLKGL